MKLFRTYRATIARPADNTAYAAGDEVSNHATAGSVVRATVNLDGFTQGRLLGAAMDITPASGNFINTAANFELSLWKATDLPSAVGDNVTHPIAAAEFQKALGVFWFDDGGWTGQLGAAAGTVTSAFQRVNSHLVNPLATPGLQEPAPRGIPFSFVGDPLANRTLTIVLRALAAWTPTGVINTFGIYFDVEAE